MRAEPRGRAGRCEAASSVAPVPSRYERSLRPCLASTHRTPATSLIPADLLHSKP